MPELVENLKSIALPGWERDDSVRDATSIIAAPAPAAREPSKRTMIALERATNARDAIERLPAAGETMHGWMSGGWDAWNVVGRVLELAAPATIGRLTVATLGFNKDNTESLLRFLDSGAIGSVSFLCSHYYKSNEGEVVAMLAAELAARGSRFAAARSHAKILLFELTDGRCLTWRSSANLRSCRNMEQWDLTHDRGLLEYDRAVIDGMLDAVGA